MSDGPKYCSGWWQGCWAQSGYGFGSPDKDYGPNGQHPGIDLGLPFGTPLYAAEGGIIAFAGWAKGTGNTVVLVLQDGTQVLFGHLSHIDVKAGDQVGSGFLLGQSGDSGNSTGAHLHFQVNAGKSLQPVDPVAWLKNHLDLHGLFGTNLGAQPTGDPTKSRSPLDVPGAISDFADALKNDLARAGWVLAGLVLVLLGFGLLVVPEIVKRSPAAAPLRVLKGGVEEAPAA